MQKSKITWTDATWNPWMGCKKVSPGCKFCYMHRILDNNGKNGSEVFRTGNAFHAPLNWLQGKTVFTCSMSDFFIEEADEWRAEAWDIIKTTQRHTYLILTKRPERIKECLPEDWNSENYSNVWLGVSVETEEQLHRIHQLGEIPCAIRWVSFEPLLAEIYLTDKELSLIDWAVLGG